MSNCPCCGDCCDKPDISGMEHECSDESTCEECYSLECKNCGDNCCCEL